jgi:hypothetical protein
MTDPRLVPLLLLAVVMMGILILALLLRGGPSGAGGSALDLVSLLDWLKGKKTYIGIVLTALNNYAARRGWIDQELCNQLNYALVPLTGIALVAKMNRTEQKVETAVTAAKIAAVTRPKEGV